VVYSPESSDSYTEELQPHTDDEYSDYDAPVLPKKSTAASSTRESAVQPRGGVFCLTPEQAAASRSSSRRKTSNERLSEMRSNRFPKTDDKENMFEGLD